MKAHGDERIGSFAGDAKSYDSHTEECSGVMTNKDILIRQLRMDLEQARKHQQIAERNLRECEMDLVKQDGQIEKLQDEQTLRASNVSAKDRRIKLLETQYKNSKAEV